MSRLSPDSVEAVRGAVDMVDLVGGRTQLEAGRGAIFGPLPVP